MEVQQASLLTVMIVLGSLMVLGGGSLLAWRIFNQRRLYRDLQPPDGNAKADSSAHVVFIVLAFFSFALGLLLLGLGIFGTVVPEGAGLTRWLA